MPPSAALPDRLPSPPLRIQTLVVTTLCVLVYWIWLGYSPFAMSEAHRALPAWEMLDSRHWLVPTLFEQPYLRKPPGIQWIFALSSWLLGNTEFAARLPSALAMTLASLLTLRTAAKWWSPQWSMWAGLAHALTPLFWYPGRSAEIESVHNLFVQCAMIGGIEVLMRHRSDWRTSLMLVLGIVGASLTKGPAGLPCLAGILIGAAAASRSLAPLLNRRWWILLVTAGAIVGLVLWLIRHDVETRSLSPVLQSPAGFLWDSRKLADILLLPLIALLTAAPASLTFPWLLRRSASEVLIARAIFWSVLGALCIYSWIGVSNSRYAMPALGMVPLGVAWFLHAASERAGDSTPARAGPRAVLIVCAGLLVGAIVNVWHSETRRTRISGRDAGTALAKLLPDGATIWANQVLEYRPEVLWYGKTSAAADGRTLRYLWMPGAGAGRDALPPPGTYLLLLSTRDPAVSTARFETPLPTWQRLGEAVVHKHTVELWRVPPETVTHTLDPMTPILPFERSIRNLRRYADILSIMVKYGLGDVVQELGLERVLERGARIATVGQISPEFHQMPRQVRLRKAMEELGPTFIKLGQVLSTRPDLIPQAWAQEFEKLQDDAPRLDPQVVKARIREELGDKVETLFESIEDAPLGAASMAQTHAARLRTGEDVVIKVLRPNIRSITESDMEAMRFIAEFAEERFGDLGYSPIEVVNQFAKELSKEVDLTMEGRATDRLRSMFTDDPMVVFPKVYWEATTSTVLTVERMQGLLLSKLQEGDLTPDERRSVVESGARAQLKQCLEVGFFHADPHPGNLFALPGGRIGFIDCGMTGQLDDRTTQDLAELVAGVVQGDLEQVLGVIESLANVDPATIENRAFRADVREFIARFDSTPLDQLNFGLLLREFFDKIRAHKIRCPADMVLLIKALTTIERVATDLDPTFELATYARPYVVALVKRKYSVTAAHRRLRSSMFKYAQLAEDLPREVRNILGMVKQNKLAVNLEHRGLQRLTDTINSASRAVSVALLIAALLVGSSILVLAARGTDGMWLKVLGSAGFLLAAVLSIGMVVRR